MKKISLILFAITIICNSAYCIPAAQRNRAYIKIKKATKNSEILYVNDIGSLLTTSSNNDLIITVKDAKRGGMFYYEKNPALVENGGTIFAAKDGGFWIRKFSGPVLLDWFNPAADGVTDDSPVIQKALNAAYKSTLTLTKGKVYRFINCYLPADIIVDLNGATIKPYFNAATHGNAMFYQNPSKINIATGLPDNVNGSYKATASVPIVVTNNQLLNGIYDAEGYNLAFCLINAPDNYTTIKYVKIANNDIRNCGAPSGVFTVYGAGYTSRISGHIENVDISNNIIEWSGANEGLIIKEDYGIGATSLNIRTIDGGPINERVMVGRFIQVAGTGTTNLDRGNTYKTSGSVYRITAFLPTSASEGTISIASGDYSLKGGWIADDANQGLRFATVTNSWILPVSVTRFSSICIYPSFTGASGATLLTRASNSLMENANATALYPGLKISFVNSCKGFYTIHSINKDNGSITITPALSSAVNGQKVFIPGNISPSSVFGGDIRTLNVAFNKFIGGSHGCRLGGTSMGKGYYNDSLKSHFNFHDNEFSYNSMNMEAQTGTPDPVTSMKAIFDGLTLKAGQTAVSIPNSTKYRVLQKDVDGDGKSERVLVLNNTADANITPFNSMEAGDIFTIDGVKGDYIISDISADWVNKPVITVSRWDVNSKSPIPGGLFNGVASSLSSNGSLNARVFSKAVGAYGSFGQLDIQHNKFSYPTDSYHMSLSACDFIVKDNDFETCERSSFEIAGKSFRFLNNRVKATVFNGQPIPAGVGFADGRGCGGGFSLTAANIDIEGNEFDSNIPSTGGYSSNAGQFTTTKNVHGVDNEEKFLLKKNTFNGFSGILTRPINYKTIQGTSYAVYGYDYFEISNNIFNYNSSSATIILRTVHGYNTVISNNVFNFGLSKSVATLFMDMPNPEMFPQGSYTVKLFGNTYSTAVVNASLINKENVKRNIQSQDKKLQ